MNARLTGVVAAAAASVLILAGCSASPAGTAGPAGQATASASLPGRHVHGVVATADGTRVLLGTHQGIFALGADTPERLGPPDDFMGFVGDPAGTLWASGHPGPGSSKPNPLGLLRSADGGRTWATVSNAGVSDFHALAVTKSGLVGFDGALKRSSTGETWTDVPTAIHPAVLAGHAASDTVLATTEKGLFASPDAGATWNAVPGAPLIQFAAFADAQRVIGIAPDGAVYASADAGLSWNRTGTVSGGVEAMTAAAPAANGPVRVWAATEEGLRESRDGGATFTAYEPGQP